MEIAATLILLAGVIDDLRSQKVHNKLIIALFSLTVLALIIISGPFSLVSGSVSFLLALGFAIPLALAGVIGGGDMKLFAVFGLATNTHAVLEVAAFSLIWGALLGTTRAILMGQGKSLLLSTTQLLWTKGGPGSTEFRIPYTVALLFGWMSHLTLMHLGISLW